jgi:transposase
VLVEEIHGSIINRHGRKTIIAALTGVITQADSDMMRQIREEIDVAERHKQECIDKMQEICEKEYSGQLRNLQTIPGVKLRAATSLIAEIGTDMSHFETANHLASWSGLKPRNDESNKVIKSKRITHGNRYLRRTIVECGWAASRTKGCFFSRFSYHQTQVRKKTKMKVQIAISRKLLICAWHILSKNVPYQDFCEREIS